jgi:Uma2 family endonuclease
MTSARAAAMPARMTAEQLLELPDDGYRHELIRGELQSMAPAGEWHGQVALTIGRLVGNHVYENRLGRCYAAETGFVTGRDPDTVRAPDLAFVSTERLTNPPSHRFSTMIPDLVAEVVSPSDRASEVTEKALSWLDYGVRLVWVIDPRARLVTVHRPGDVIGLVRGEKAVLDGADVLPGFRVTLDDLFA